jgi:hypothetical protein
VALGLGQGAVDRQAIFAREMSDDRVAVSDMFAIVDDVGQLAARRRLRIENMFVPEGQSRELQERKNLEPERIVVRDSEQFGIGIQAEHVASRPRQIGVPKRPATRHCIRVAVTESGHTGAIFQSL